MSDPTNDIADAHAATKSWRQRLWWVRDTLLSPDFEPTPANLAALAVYLRFLSNGQLACEEDGRHYRPNHHADAAEKIEAALERMAGPDTDWLLRRIFPHLPSWAADFRRSEPLTRIRDIAHRNDIPHDLKQEIKRRLQNKLHRCAGPEDLRTCEEMLARFTAPGAHYPPAFVSEFRTFHAELREFFNAAGLDDRLRETASDPALADAASALLTAKADGAEPAGTLERLTALRRSIADRLPTAEPFARSRLRLTDIALEDFAFALLSDAANRLGGNSAGRNRSGSEAVPPQDPTNGLADASGSSGRAAWEVLLRLAGHAAENLRLSGTDPEEAAAVASELAAWAEGFDPAERFHLLRLRATLQRAARLAAGYADRANAVLAPVAERLGRLLGVAEPAVRVFAESDIRSHVAFQLSKLCGAGLAAARRALALPPWEAVVAGTAVGTLLRAGSLTELESQPGPLVVLLGRAEGDEEIASAAAGIVSAHPIPQLSHLGVRARQARVPFAAAESPDALREFDALLGKTVRLTVTAEGMGLAALPPGGIGDGGERAADRATMDRAATSPPGRDDGRLLLPEVVASREACALPLQQVRRETAGAKADAARRLRELAAESGGLFAAPRGLAVPFGVMELAVDADPAGAKEYADLVARADSAGRDAVPARLRGLLAGLPVAEAITAAVAEEFGPAARLAVRSSANGEDLETLAGAGLYESVLNVPAGDADAVADAVRRVWASLWTRRAAASRAQAGITHDRVRMAVLIQEMVAPDLSFILHTADPQTGRRGAVVAELAVGLGEVLASAGEPGTPYRLECGRDQVRLTACSSFSFALRPGADGGVLRERLDHSRVRLSADRAFAESVGRRLAAVGAVLEERLGGPQDVEGVLDAAGTVHVVQSRPQQGL